ncbi:MAG TPA: M23 family metallopeptidase [Dehalococcoidia bacterium]|nr:M23 family metallopeptidase [Dehalococcoidia bacterium]
MLLGAACGGGGNAAGNDGGVVIETVVAQPSATPVVIDTKPSSTPTGTQPASSLTGFAWPIAGGCLPKGDQLMPNAPRVYRNGIHEGVDFYAVDNCNTTITKGTPVMAAKAGKVIRIDTDYHDLTQAEYDKNNANPNTPEALDSYRGRQVWIDHGNGIVTRYCHLSAIANGLTLGATVTKGQVIGSVGESGTPESLSSPGSEYHLHFELRTGDSYLGKGLSAQEVRNLYTTLFAQ